MALSLGGVEFGIQVNAKGAVAQINRIAKALQNLQQVAGAVPHDLLDIFKNSGGVASSAKSLASAIETVASAMGAWAIQDAVTDSTILAARVQNLDTVMRNMGATAHYTDGELSLYEQQVRKLGITTQVTREVLSKFAQNGLDLAKASDIARIAQDAAVISGQNSSEVTEKLTIAIQRLDTRMLRNVGILVNLRQEYQQYALATGRVETQLTAAEKQQILMNAVMRQGAALSGNYEKSLGDVYKQYTSLDRVIEEATVQIGQNFIPIMQVLVNVVDAVGQVLAKNTGFSATVVAIFAGIATAGLAAITVIGGVTLAMNAMAAAGIALSFSSPVGWVIAAAAAIGGLVVAMSSWSAQSRLITEENRKQESAVISLQERVRALIKDLTALSEVQNASGAQQQLMRDRLKELFKQFDTLPEYQDRLRPFLNDAESFLKELQAISSEGQVDFITPINEQLLEADQIIQAIEARLQDLEQAMPETGDGFLLAGIFELSTAEIDRNREALAKWKNMQKSLQDQADAPRLRELDEQAVKMEAAYEVAMRTSKQLEESRVSATKDANVAIIAESNAMLAKLHDGMMREVDIVERAELLKKDLRKKFAQQRLDSPKNEEKINLEEKSALDAIDRDKEDAFKQQKAIAKSFSDVFANTGTSLGRDQDAIANMREELRLLAQEAPAGAIKAMHDIADAQRQEAISAAYTTEVIEKLRMKLQEVSLAQESAKLLGDGGTEAMQGRQAEVLKQQIANAEQAERQSRERSKLEQQKYFDDLVTQHRDAKTKQLSEERSYADSIRGLQKQVSDERIQTQDFLTKKSIELYGEEFDGQSNFLQMAQEFRSAASGVGGADQGQQLLQAFEESFAAQFGDPIGGTPEGDAYEQVRSQIQQAIADKLAETQRAIQQVALQRQQLAETTKQTAMLSQIVSGLRGQGLKSTRESTPRSRPGGGIPGTMKGMTLDEYEQWRSSAGDGVSMSGVPFVTDPSITRSGGITNIPYPNAYPGMGRGVAGPSPAPAAPATPFDAGFPAGALGQAAQQNLQATQNLSAAVIDSMNSALEAMQQTNEKLNATSEEVRSVGSEFGKTQSQTEQAVRGANL